MQEQDHVDEPGQGRCGDNHTPEGHQASGRGTSSRVPAEQNKTPVALWATGGSCWEMLAIVSRGGVLEIPGSLNIGFQHGKAPVPGLVGKFPKLCSSVGPKQNHGLAHAIHLACAEKNSVRGHKGLPQAAWSMGSAQRLGGHVVAQGT